MAMSQHWTVSALSVISARRPGVDLLSPDMNTILGQYLGVSVRYHTLFFYSNSRSAT